MSFRRALFIKTKHLGDSVILTSSIAGLPEDWEIDVFCFHESNVIFQCNPRVGEIFNPSRAKSLFRYAYEYADLLKKLRSRRYELVVQFSDDWRGALISRILNPKLSVCGQSSRRPKIWHKLFKSVVKRPRHGRHSAEMDFDLLRRTGLIGAVATPKYDLRVSNSAISHVEQWLSDRKLSVGSYTIVHASSRWMFKTLQIGQWRAIISGLASAGHSVILTGSSDDLEFNQKIGLPSTLIAQNFGIQESVWLIKHARIIVSIDSFPVHVASAMGTPVVAIFGPSGEDQWGPWRTSYRVVEQSDMFKCRPCGLDGCGSSKVSQCLVTLPTQRIFAAVEELTRASSNAV